MPDKPYPSQQEIQSCISVLRSRQTTPGPDIAFISFNFVNLIGGSLSDIPVHAPFPCNTFFLTSIKPADTGNSIIMHFVPDLLKRAALPTPLSGLQQFIPLNNVIATGPVYYSVLRLNKPIQDFFLDVGTENGEGPTFTLACVSDLSIRITGGQYRRF